MEVVRQDVLRAAGPLQLCCGQECGAEAAVHAMRAMFEHDSSDAVLLVDASNTFNNLNRPVALHNIRYICPEIATLLINCYRIHSSLFVGGTEMFS